MKPAPFFYLPIFLFSALAVTAQQTRSLNNPESGYQQARAYFEKEQYSLAYPLLQEMQAGLRETDRSNRAILYQQVRYMGLVCGLKQDEQTTVSAAEEFIRIEDHQGLVELMRFHLGEYFFRRRDFLKALELYRDVSVQQLSNREVADLKFHQAYAYFSTQQLSLARPLFNAVRQVKTDPHYTAANYYYGFIAFYEKRYAEALESFLLVEGHPEYGKAAPYFISVIYFMDGDRSRAFAYAEKQLKQGGLIYERELLQLVGHGYYLQQLYPQALPYLERYATQTPQRSKEDIFELAFCHYKTDNWKKAIDGFKQLSGKEDSLAQYAMYLLGDAYLRTGQKGNARNAFLFCSSNSSNDQQREVSLFNYAKLSFELGYQDIALKELQQFLTGYPRSTYTEEARELLLRVLANTNNYREALVLMESLKNPSAQARNVYPRILYGRATELVNDGMLVSAQELLNRAESYPDNIAVLPFLLFWKGEIAYRLSKWDEAIRYYQDYLKYSLAQGEVNPVHARYNLGYCFMRKENYRLALVYFEQVAPAALRTGTAPLEQDAYLRASDCYYMNRDFRKAQSMYEKVIDNAWPASDYATFQVALIRGIESSRQKIEWLQALSRKYPGSSLLPDAQMEIAATYLANEQYQESIPFLKTVADDPGNTLQPRALLRMGIAYFNSNNNEEALRQYSRLLEQYPNAPEAEDALDNAKAIYVEEGNSTAYVNFARKLGKEVSAGQEEQLAYQEAELQFNNGNFPVAANKFEDYLRRFPNAGRVLEALYYKSEIYADQKNWTKAAEGYEQLADRIPHKFGEKSLLSAARLNFFEIKDYLKGERYFEKLKSYGTSQETRLEAMRGVLRCQFQLQQWAKARANALELLEQKSIGTDDRILANMALARSYQQEEAYAEAITFYRNVASLSKAAYGAEARYQIASCYFVQSRLEDAEKASFEVINKSGSYEEWVIRAYLLLGDIYFRQKDYFNAKATYQSVLDHSKIEALRLEAEKKMARVAEEEGKK